MQNPYSYLENPRGTTIHDRNFDNVIPGYTPELGHTLNVKVVPNPYIVHSTPGYNESEWRKKIRFIHLPERCTIHIFTVSGERVNTLEKTDINDGAYEWDLRTYNNQEIAPGLYIYVVESPGGGKIIDKFAVVR